MTSDLSLTSLHVLHLVSSLSSFMPSPPIESLPTNIRSLLLHASYTLSRRTIYAVVLHKPPHPLSLCSRIFFLGKGILHISFCCHFKHRLRCLSLHLSLSFDFEPSFLTHRNSHSTSV